jgi:hypothetical protein
MSEPLIRRVTHEVVNDPAFKLPQLVTTLLFEGTERVCNSAIYPEYVHASDDGWFYLCSLGMRHQTTLFNKLFWGDR